jgi:hypothetical protein
LIHLALFAALALQDDGFAYTTRDGSIAVSGFAPGYRFSYDSVTGSFSASGTGNPARIMLNSTGLSITAKSIAGAANRTDLKTYYLTESHTSSQSVIVVDSAVAQTFQKKAAVAPKVRPETNYRIELDTDRTDYSGTESEGSLTLPTPLDLMGHIEGERQMRQNNKDVRQSFVQQFKFHALSGKLNVDPRPDAGVRAIKDGAFEGPITFSLKRTETNLDTKSLSEFIVENGRCDRMRIATDDTGESLILDGNVAFDVLGDWGVMHVRKGDSFAFKFDPNLTPIFVKGMGNPFETTVPTKGRQ